MRFKFVKSSPKHPFFINSFMINLVSQKAGEIEDLRERIDQFSKSQDLLVSEKEELESQLAVLREEKATVESELKNQLETFSKNEEKLKTEG